MYPVGFPLWRWWARRNGALVLRVQVQRDPLSGGYSATSSGLPGLLVRARTRECLMRRVYACTQMLLADEVGQPLPQPPCIAWDGVLGDALLPSPAWRVGSHTSWV